MRAKYLYVPGVLLPGLASVYAIGCIGDESNAPPATPTDAGRDATVPVDGARPPPPDSSTGDSGIVTDADAGPAFGRIEGVVLSYGPPDQGVLGVVPQARVSVAGTALTATTDDNGRFALDNVPTGERVLLDVNRPTPRGTDLVFSSTQAIVRVTSGATAHAFPRLAPGCAFRDDIDADGGRTASTSFELQWCPYANSASRLEIPAPSLARQDNSIFSGRVRVEMVPTLYVPRPDAGLDLSTFAYLPGDMTGVTKAGASTRVESLGAIELRVFDDVTDAPLKVAAGKTVTIVIEPHRDAITGEAFTAWSYDLTRGAWVEEAAGGAFDDAGGRIFRVEASHLSWWNIDRPIPSVGCVRGRLTAAGAPVAGVATAQAIAAGYSATASTDTAGTFCVGAPAGAAVTVTGAHASAAGFAVGGKVAAASVAGSCDAPSACTDVGDIALAPPPVTCLRSRATTYTAADGGSAGGRVGLDAPLTLYANVPSNGVNWPVPLGRFRSDDAGAFCAPAVLKSLDYVLHAESYACPPGTDAFQHARIYRFGVRPPDGGTDAAVPGAACNGPSCVVSNDVYFDCYSYGDGFGHESSFR